MCVRLVSWRSRVRSFCRWDWSKYFLRLFSPFRWFKKDCCLFLVKECAQVLVNDFDEDYACPGKSVSGKLTTLDITLMGWLCRKTWTQTKQKTKNKTKQKKKKKKKHKKTGLTFAKFNITCTFRDQSRILALQTLSVHVSYNSSCSPANLSHCDLLSRKLISYAVSRVRVTSNSISSCIPPLQVTFHKTLSKTESFQHIFISKNKTKKWLNFYNTFLFYSFSVTAALPN